MRNIRALESEVQNLSEFNGGGLFCPHSGRPYAVVCFNDLLRIERRLESAEPGLMVMAVILAIVMIATIVSLGVYVRHLRKKLDYSKGNDNENSGSESHRSTNTRNNNEVVDIVEESRGTPKI